MSDTFSDNPEHGVSDALPLVSIVTPSFQSGGFIERTIESVLSQSYPNIEYIVMDGGSTDGTLEILDRYRGRLQYVSAPDGGAADAINRGFKQSRGSIFGWLSADDLYFPGALETAVRQFSQSPDVGVIYGEGVWIDEAGEEITTATQLPRLIAKESSNANAASVSRPRLCGGTRLKPSACYSAIFTSPSTTTSGSGSPASGDSRRFPACWPHRACIEKTKRSEARLAVFEENVDVLRRHYGYVPMNWIYGYLSYRRDGRDQFFQPLRHSVRAFLMSLPEGLKYNRKHPLRYAREWAAKLTGSNFRSLSCRDADKPAR